MALEIKPQTTKIRRDNFENEKEFLLMKFQGIFKKNIKEYSEMVVPKLRNKKNYSI